MIFDTHAHYNDEQFDQDRDELLGKMKDAGVGTVMEIGASLASSQRAVDLAGRISIVSSAASRL